MEKTGRVQTETMPDFLLTLFVYHSRLFVVSSDIATRTGRRGKTETVGETATENKV